MIVLSTSHHSYYYYECFATMNSASILPLFLSSSTGSHTTPKTCPLSLGSTLQKQFIIIASARLPFIRRSLVSLFVLYTHLCTCNLFVDFVPSLYSFLNTPVVFLFVVFLFAHLLSLFTRSFTLCVLSLLLLCCSSCLQFLPSCSHHYSPCHQQRSSPIFRSFSLPFSYFPFLSLIHSFSFSL